MIAELIDKLDSFEIVRDKIGDILKTELMSQMVLADSTPGKNPEDWKVRVYTEKSNPFEEFLNEPVEDESPLINVWYESSTFDMKSSNIVKRQKSDSVYNIDCYGYGVAQDDPNGGHKPGDREAALKVQKALKLARNILMASEYTYLGLQGLVWQRWTQSMTVFQPQLNAQDVQQIVGARLILRVGFSEFSPQFDGVPLELLTVTTRRAEDGEILIEQEFDYT